MPSPHRIVFVNRFYWPDEPATAQLLTDLAEGLVQQGFAVTVIARQPPGERPPVETHHGVEIVRIRGSALGRKNLVGRSFDFLSFIAGVRRHLSAELKAGDTLVCMTDPPMLGSALAGLAVERGAYLFHWIQDIFPEVASAVSGVKWFNALSAARDRAWRAAQLCITPGNDMARFVEDRGIYCTRVAVCENWAPAGVGPAEPAAWRAEHGLSDRFVVMYSGNLGRVHDFDSIVPLARSLANDPRIQLVFVGHGARRELLEANVRGARLSNVRFLPPQPRAVLSNALSSGDLHLVTLRAGCENLVFPSKLYGVAAIGRPALVLGPNDCEPTRRVREGDFGAGFTPDNIDAISGYIRALATDPARCRELGENATRFAQAHTAALAIEFWACLLTAAPVD